jgi:hypothetical protein
LFFCFFVDVLLTKSSLINVLYLHVALQHLALGLELFALLEQHAGFLALVQQLCAAVDVKL